MVITRPTISSEEREEAIVGKSAIKALAYVETAGVVVAGGLIAIFGTDLIYHISPLWRAIFVGGEIGIVVLGAEFIFWHSLYKSGCEFDKEIKKRKK